MPSLPTHLFPELASLEELEEAFVLSCGLSSNPLWALLLYGAHRGGGLTISEGAFQETRCKPSSDPSASHIAQPLLVTLRYKQVYRLATLTVRGWL